MDALRDSADAGGEKRQKQACPPHLFTLRARIEKPREENQNAGTVPVNRRRDLPVILPAVLETAIAAVLGDPFIELVHTMADAVRTELLSAFLRECPAVRTPEKTVEQRASLREEKVDVVMKGDPAAGAFLESLEIGFQNIHVFSFWRHEKQYTSIFQEIKTGRKI